MSVSTTILALYPFFMFFLQAAPPPDWEKPRVTEVRIHRVADEAELTVATGEPAEHARYVIDLLPAGSQ